MEILGKEQKEQKEQVEYSCGKCNFVCYRKYNWDRHILTPKHLKEIVGNDKKEQKEQQDKNYICICGKKFQTNAGLWKHNKVCNQTQIKKDEQSNKELIMMLIKENSELKKEQTDIKELILEIVKNISKVATISH